MSQSTVGGCWMRRVALTAACGLSLSLAGCEPAEDTGEFPLVQVSGVVTLDNEPLADANVTFQPEKIEGTKASGPGSQGRTDAQGRFTLQTATEPRRPGAVVGTHQVTISTYREAGDPDNPQGASFMQAPEKVPSRYMLADRPTAVVPPGGTDSLVFPLTTEPPTPDAPSEPSPFGQSE